LSGLGVNDEAQHVGLLRGGAPDRPAREERPQLEWWFAAPSRVGTMPISIILLCFAALRVLRELRANQLALRSLRSRRQHRRSREVREDREGTRRTAIA